MSRAPRLALRGVRCPAGGQFAAAVLAIAAVAAPGLCRAQVIELGTGGSVRVYDRPSVFDAAGATPIAEPAPHRRRVAGAATPSSAVADAARAADLSPALIEAVAWRESRGRHGAVSAKGAIGEMQLLPSTARALGVDPSDTRRNYQGGAAYLRLLMRRYDGDLVRTLAAYNAGPGAVARYGGPPPFAETRAYIDAVLDRLGARSAQAQDDEGTTR